jgi:hypothetical protein
LDFIIQYLMLSLFGETIFNFPRTILLVSEKIFCKKIKPLLAEYQFLLLFYVTIRTFYKTKIKVAERRAKYRWNNVSFLGPGCVVSSSSISGVFSDL